MSQHATDLCVLLVENFYGELSSRTLGALFLYGRLSFSTLLNHTGFTPSQLRHSLAVLVQAHLAFWYTSTDDDLTNYEANPLGCYSLVRSGKYITIAEERYGLLAGAIVSEIIQSGSSGVGDLVLALKESKAHIPNGFPNGFPNDHLHGLKHTPCSVSMANGAPKQAPFITEELIHETLSHLLGSGLLATTNEFYFYADADKRTEAEKRTFQVDKLDKIKKDEAEDHERAVMAQLSSWKYGTQEELNGITKFKASRKRPLENGGSDRGSKRLRTASGDQLYNNGFLSEETILRISHEKFMVLERSNQFAELAKLSIGSVSSQIYRKVLESLEKDVQQCKSETKLARTILDVVDLDDEPEPRSLPQVRTEDLQQNFTNFPEMIDAIGSADQSKVNIAQYDHPKKRRRKLAATANVDIDMVDTDDQMSPDESDTAEDDEGNISGIEIDSDDPNEWNNDVAFNPNDPNSRKRKRKRGENSNGPPSPLRQHLFLLSSQSCKLLHHLPALRTTTESWSVDFDHLSRHLFTSAIFQTVTGRFGPLAGRLLRILHQKGKLDEKSLTSFALVGQKSMRALLTSMNRAGFLELQEVPKGNDRQPSKTIFLWYFDQERCRQRMLNDTYKAMTRALQRIGVEREKVRGTVEKSERMDVQGNEEGMLSDDEKRALREWRAREERLLGEIGKLDDFVALLRDF